MAITATGTATNALPNERLSNYTKQQEQTPHDPYKAAAESFRNFNGNIDGNAPPEPLHDLQRLPELPKYLANLDLCGCKDKDVPEDLIRRLPELPRSLADAIRKKMKS